MIATELLNVIVRFMAFKLVIIYLLPLGKWLQKDFLPQKGFFLGTSHILCFQGGTVIPGGTIIVFSKFSRGYVYSRRYHYSVL